MTNVFLLIVRQYPNKQEHNNLSYNWNMFSICLLFHLIHVYCLRFHCTYYFRYRDFRYPPGHHREYQYSIYYWHVVAAKMAFIIVVEVSMSIFLVQSNSSVSKSKLVTTGTRIIFVTIFHNKSNIIYRSCFVQKLLRSKHLNCFYCASQVINQPVKTIFHIFFSTSTLCTSPSSYWPM